MIIPGTVPCFFIVSKSSTARSGCLPFDDAWGEMAVSILFCCIDLPPGELLRIFLENFSVLAGGRCPPPTPPIWAGGGFAQTPPLKRSFVTFDRGGQTGPPRSNAFFSAPLTIRAPLMTQALLTIVRRPEAKCTSAACRMPSLNFLQPCGRV